MVKFASGATIFTQGDPCEHVLYIQKGTVKLSVISKAGREAVVAMLSAGEFFGEGRPAGQPIRMGTAAATTDSVILLVEKQRMVNCCTSSARCRIASSRICSRATSKSKKT
jgi:CRP-like cAMP-binding protein